MAKHKYRSPTYWLFVIWMAWFIAGSLYIGIHALPQSDDALRAIVAKNWVNGLGPVSSYSDIVPFPDDISIGPMVLIPEGLLILLAGNQMWIPGVVAAGTNLIILLSCFRQILKYWRIPLAAMAGVLTTISIFMPRDFTTTTGYYTIALLFLLAVLLAFDPNLNLRMRNSFVAIVLGLACLTKTIAIIGATSLFVFIAITDCRASGWRFAILNLACMVAIFFVLLLPWGLYRNYFMSQFDPEFIQAWKDYNWEFFAYHGSGIGQLIDAEKKSEYMFGNAIRNIRIFSDSMKENNISYIVFILGVFFSLASSAIFLKKNIRKSESLVVLGVALISITYLAWFILISFSITPGHSVTAVHMGCLAIFLALANTINAIALPFIFAIMMFLVIKANPHETQVIYDFSIEDTYKNDSIKQAILFIQQNNFSYPLVGCGFFGYPRHLEYSMPGSLHFRDCYDMIADSVSLDNKKYEADNIVEEGKTPLEDFYNNVDIKKIQYDFTWKTTPGFTLVLSFPSMVLDPYMGKIIAVCKNNILFRSSQVWIMECSPDSMRQHVELNEIMRDIVVMQRWYKTRINPYEGKSFPTYRTQNVEQ